MAVLFSFLTLIGTKALAIPDVTMAILLQPQKDPAAKVKVVVYDRSGRKFSCSKITTADDYATMASRPQYPVEPGWEE